MNSEMNKGETLNTLEEMVGKVVPSPVELSEMEDAEDAGVVLAPEPKSVDDLGSFLFQSLGMMNRAAVEQYKKAR